MSPTLSDETRAKLVPNQIIQPPPKRRSLLRSLCLWLARNLTAILRQI